MTAAGCVSYVCTVQQYVFRTHLINYCVAVNRARNNSNNNNNSRPSGVFVTIKIQY